ncbi:MAG: tRNA (N(6)-L-threonylcarbamoyladenosine(37)-C(2))-methylthiotransferase MtaB [Clostridia bacterium]|nr:tRNA (N(6)-L-threonylcarbamoyladenosine(37)-C(2))-methylthiotransferase MtaB [Clostridia bacterium]
MIQNGAPTAAVYTLGCRLNQYESTAIEETLAARGFLILPFSEKCDVYIINTCAVTEESEKKSRKLIRRAHSENPEAFVIVAGCASQVHSDVIAKIPSVSYVCGNRNKLSAAEAACALIRGEDLAEKTKIEDVESAPLEKMSISRSERTRAFVKIEDGCDNHCTYCIIKTARGNVVSRPAEEIVAEVEKLCRAGYEEAVLTGVETASYGKDFGGKYSLADLIRDVAEKTPIKRIRLGSLEPSILKKDFVDALASEKKFMPSFHLSLQSGSNKVLADMKRKYNREIVLAGVEYIKSVIPDATFTCDIIAGFPGESEADFADTYDIARKIGFLHMHVFPFSKREGTPAAVMPCQLPESVKNERVKRLMELDEALRRENAERFIGRTVDVLFETEKDGVYTGHAPNMLEVCAEAGEDVRGKIVPVTLCGYDGEKAIGTVGKR